MRSSTDLGEDGFNDLALKFDTQEIVNALVDPADGDCLALKLTGNLKDGTEFEGEDVIVIRKKSWPATRMTPALWPERGPFGAPAIDLYIRL